MLYSIYFDITKNCLNNSNTLKKIKEKGGTFMTIIIFVRLILHKSRLL